ncbi:unnamed protein product [Auanema sp. JU1783]|nr:unnamed protein product [Auanema sp. JU1783]
MALNLGKLSPLFCSLQDGTFWDTINNFDDDELKVFLPFLISSCFHNDASGDVFPELLARLCQFPEGNRILTLIRQNRTEFEEKFQTSHEGGFNIPFCKVDDITKLAMVIRFFNESSKDEFPAGFISDDEVPDAAMLLSLGYINYPHLLPFGKITLKSLSFPNGPQLLITMLMNSVELLNPVLNILMGLQVSEESSIGRQKGVLLTQLFELCPRIHLSILRDMASSKRDCLLAVRLAAQFLDDEAILNFILPLTWNKSTQLVQTLSKASSRSTLTILHDRLYKMASRIVEKNDKQPYLTLLQSLMTIQNNCSLKPSPEQLNILCSLICRVNVEDDAYLEFALASLLAILSLTSFPQNQLPVNRMDEMIVAFLKHLAIEITKEHRESLRITVIYVGVCLSGLRTDFLKTFLLNIFKTKITIPPRQVQLLRTTFFSSCLSECELATRCATLPVSVNLNSEFSGRSPIHSVHDLLCSGTFARFNVDLGPWLENQIMASSVPVHNVLSEVVERFAAESARAGRSGLRKKFIDDLFEGDILSETVLTARVVTLLYLLSYRSQMDQLAIGAVDNFFRDIYSSIPIRFLLSIVECRGTNYSSCRTSIMRLATDIFPYMLPTIDSVKIARAPGGGMSFPFTTDEYFGMLKRNEIGRILKVLDASLLSDLVKQLPFIVELFRKSLDKDVLLPNVDSVITLWSRLENVVPRMFWVSCLQNKEMSLADIYEYPTLLFRCDRRILSSPKHFSCFIRMLTFFSAASKNLLMRSVHTANCSLNEVERQERDVLSIAVDHTRGSLLIQLLIEVSDPKRMQDEQTPSALKRRRLVRKIACEYIHQLFIMDKNIMKLVLFQTFPLHMVPYLVEDVPSMFVARDFLQEMLSLPDIKRRIFGISLMIHVSKKYRITATCASTDLILDVLHTLLRFCEASINVKLFLKIVPTLAEINSVFPQLSSDVTHLLMRVYSLAANRMALNPLVVECQSQEKQLMALIKNSLADQVNVAPAV